MRLNKVKFVIVGLGSIGKRHQQNLQQLGHEIVPCHRDDNLSQLLEQERPDGVFVCNPTSLHLPTSLETVKAGCHLFIEKPISHNLSGVDKLLGLAKEKKIVLQVGYCLRFEPELKKIKHKLEQNKIGKVKKATIIAQSCLSDWRPDTDYKQSYSAKKSLGGGVLLDLSHEIDYAVWFFGKVKTVKAKLGYSQELGIETEAEAELKLVFESEVEVEISLDYLNKKHLRNCQIMGEKGNLAWDFKAIVDQGWDINEMYIEELKNFIEAIKGTEKPLVTGEEAKYVLHIVETAKKSGDNGKVVSI